MGWFKKYLKGDKSALDSWLSSDSPLSDEELKGIDLNSHEAKAALLLLVETDPLTKLFNRRGCIRLWEEQEWTHAIIIDLDGFKEVNDNKGHDMGDKLLAKVASELKTQYPDNGVIRWGGDEFLILAKSQTLPLSPQLSHPFTCGVIKIEESSKSLTDMICKADAALYIEKAAKQKKSSNI